MDPFSVSVYFNSEVIKKIIFPNLFYSCQKSDAGYQRHFPST